MTVALKNVDYQFLDVLKSLLQLRSNIELFQVDDNFIKSENHDEIPNDLTEKVLRDSEEGKNLSPVFTNIEDLMESLNA